MAAPETAQLVLSTGSRAGLVASIQLGYYVVGRDRDCQIRPKTRSVSRTHCLLCYGNPPPQLKAASKRAASDSGEVETQANRFYVLDLNSTSGTKIDGKRLEPRQWVEVKSGAELRCGKIAWSVVVPDSAVSPNGYAGSNEDFSASRIELPEKESRESMATSWPETDMPTGDSSVDESVDSSGEIDAGDVSDTQAEMLQGAAWDESDVAAFLAAHDDSDRQVRYESIRENSRRRTREKQLQWERDAGEADDPEATFFDGSPADEELEAAPTCVDFKPDSEAPSVDAGSGDTPLTAAEQRRIVAESKAAAIQKSKQERRKATHQTVSRILSGESNESLEKLKMVVLASVAVIILAFAAYQFVQFQAGPAPRVVEGID
ncbi:FHA domain-containing protein [Neorhodopirellula lusitana]|uniref:FHA domain-containing protein n=1 Tax=Neorhodopirellula lusitana TaxID=445327 RepID=UPI00384AD445